MSRKLKIWSRKLGFRSDGYIKRTITLIHKLVINDLFKYHFSYNKPTFTMSFSTTSQFKRKIKLFDAAHIYFYRLNIDNYFAYNGNCSFQRKLHIERLYLNQ